MWLSVALRADADDAEALSETLMDAGAISVSIEDADAGTPAETPQFGEPGHTTTSLWSHSKLVALFQPDAPVPAIIDQAVLAAGLTRTPPFDIEEVPDEDWVRNTQSQFAPIQINAQLWIVPSWHAAPDPAAINIEVDPGLAFGTGSHPTTRLCLEWLTDAVKPDLSVLDYGCGSGILGIAAARLGAANVLGVDIDEQALIAAVNNAEKNGVSQQMKVRHSGTPITHQFDLVVANILTNPLCMLAPAIAARVAAGGRVALSGILEQQTSQVIEAWQPWIKLEAGAVLDGWVRLEGYRSPL